MSTAHPPMRPSPKPPSKVPTMSLMKSLIPSVPFQTSSPCSHWSSSEFAERSPHHGPFHSQLSVPLGPTFSYGTAPHIQSKSRFVANISLPSRNRQHPRRLYLFQVAPPARLPVAFLRSPAPTVFPVLLAWDNKSFAIVLSTRFGSTPCPSPASSPLTTGRVVSTLS